MKRLPKFILVVAASLVLGSAQSHAGLLGSTVDVGWYYPTQNTLLADGGVAVVGGGFEYPEGSFNGAIFSMDLSDTQLILYVNGAQDFSPPAAFDGFEIHDLSGVFTSASVDGSSDFEPVISISGNTLFLNYQGINSASGVSGIDFTATNAVPEPSTWAMMLLGFAGLGFAACKQARRRAVAA